MKNIQEKTRILYVITKSNMGGSQKYVYELATSLSRDEYEVAVAFGGSGVLKNKLKEAGINTFKIKSFERDINLTKEIKAMFELRSIMKEFKPDIVHLNSSKAGGSGAFVAQIQGVSRIIFTAHGWPFYEPRGTVWRTFVWFFSYLTVFLSHKTIVVSKHDYKNHKMPFLSKKITHINTAVPPILFKEKEESRSALFREEVRSQNKHNIWAVSTGEFNKNKNLLALLNALKIHNESNEQKVFLTLMGEGEDEIKLKKFVAENNMRETVSFLGFVDNARAYLKAFDVFILPSLKEGLPYGLLEAGSAGLYCIASRVGGIPDVIQHKTTGTLIDPTDTTSIAKALGSIPHNSEQIGQMLKNDIETKFSIDQMLRKTEKLYQH